MAHPKKKALITGITGQDGSYLAELLLGLGYDVHGLVRHVATSDHQTRMARIRHLLDRISIHSGTVENYPCVYSVLAREGFDEVYHLAAQSFVPESFRDSFSTMSINLNSTHYFLESIRLLGAPTRFYFAATSEMFGKVRETPQRETTPFHPRSPYGVSKLAAFELTRNYREAHGLFAVSGILFNHESPRRGPEFVTRKVCRSAARIRAGLDCELRMGNLDARRDWGHAADYVEAMHLMLQQAEPDDFVVGTGVMHSVADLCEFAFATVNLDYRQYVKTDPQYVRPAEVDLLLADPSKAKERLGWSPRRSFEQLIEEMVRAEVDALEGRPVATPA